MEAVTVRSKTISASRFDAIELRSAELLETAGVIWRKRLTSVRDLLCAVKLEANRNRKKNNVTTFIITSHL